MSELPPSAIFYPEVHASLEYLQATFNEFATEVQLRGEDISERINDIHANNRILHQLTVAMVKNPAQVEAYLISDDIRKSYGYYQEQLAKWGVEEFSQVHGVDHPYDYILDMGLVRASLLRVEAHGALPADPDAGLLGPLSHIELEYEDNSQRPSLHCDENLRVRYHFVDAEIDQDMRYELHLRNWRDPAQGEDAYIGQREFLRKQPGFDPAMWEVRCQAGATLIRLCEIEQVRKLLAA